MKHQTDAQIKNMVAITAAFCHGCTIAIVQENGIASKEEKKALRRIQSVSERFIKELEKIK